MSNGYPWRTKPNIKNSLASFIADYSRKTGLRSRAMLFSQRSKIAKQFMTFAKKHHYFEFVDPRFTLSCVEMQIAWATTPQPDAKILRKHPSGAFIKREYKILMQLQGIELTA
jgi:hypothetical protein